MDPATNTDARYSTSNNAQRDMYVVNINSQGRRWSVNNNNVPKSRLPCADYAVADVFFLKLRIDPRSHSRGSA